MSSVVTIITNERDFGADAVIRHLQEAGCEIRRLNFESAVSRELPEWIPESEHVTDYPGVVWLRQFDAFDEPPQDLTEADDRLVARAQWRAWLSLLDVPKAIWINPLWQARKAENKIVQLRTAQEVGFAIPETMITNSRERAKAFWRDRQSQVIIKTLSAAYYELSNQSFVFAEKPAPQLFDAEEEGAWASQPVLLQRRIRAQFDARVLVFGDVCLGGRMPRPEGLIDWRVGEEDEWEPWNVPEEIERCARDYLAQLSLRYAAFDFLIEDANVWFLEANQAGEWHFLDRRLHLGLDQAMARYLLTCIDEVT